MAGGVGAIGNLRGKVSSANALVVTLDGGTASATTFLAGDGSVSAPSYSLTSDPDTGFYAVASGEIGFSSNNGLKMVFRTGGILLDAGVVLSWNDDASVSRGAAGRVDTTKAFRMTPVAFADLPTAAEGAIAWVNDSNTTTWGATVAGGGANKVLVCYNGTNWTCAGK